MEKKKPGTVTVPKENVKELLGKAKDGIVKAMDQNGDGTFDMKDVSVIAGSIGNAAKDTISAMKESAEGSSDREHLPKVRRNVRAVLLPGYGQRDLLC